MHRTAPCLVSARTERGWAGPRLEQHLPKSRLVKECWEQHDGLRWGVQERFALCRRLGGVAEGGGAGEGTVRAGAVDGARAGGRTAGDEGEGT